MYRGDGRFFKIPEAQQKVQVLAQYFAPTADIAGTTRSIVLQIHSRGERPARARQHDRAEAVIECNRVQQLIHLADHAAIDGI